MARRKRKAQGPDLPFDVAKPKAPSLIDALREGIKIEPQDHSEVLGDVDCPDIVRSKDLKVIAARGDQLRRLGKALPLCWLPGDPETTC